MTLNLSRQRHASAPHYRSRGASAVAALCHDLCLTRASACPSTCAAIVRVVLPWCFGGEPPERLSPSPNAGKGVRSPLHDDGYALGRKTRIRVGQQQDKLAPSLPSSFSFSVFQSGALPAGSCAVLPPHPTPHSHCHLPPHPLPISCNANSTHVLVFPCIIQQLPAFSSEIKKRQACQVLSQAHLSIENPKRK